LDSLAAEIIGLGHDLWEGLAHVFWFFLSGVLIAAVIRTYRIHVRARKYLPQLGFWGIFVGTLIGMFSPLCACGVLPIVVSLIVSGLPLAPAMSLVVASPLMSVEGYGVTAGLLGVDWANAKAAAALFMGIFAGLMTHFITLRGHLGTEDIFKGEMPKGNIHDPDFHDERLACHCREQWSNRIARKHPNKFIIFWAKAAELFVHVGKYTLVGLIIEVLAARYIPADWIAAVFGGDGWISIPLVTLAVVPLHLNQITAAGILYGPLNVLERLGSDISWGSGMAFLIGGPVTALPVMGVFLSLFKARVFWIYLSLCLTGTVIVSTAALLLLT
jgi:uncharacterized membrane protein YraQ (UPF0718 family)